MNLRWCFSLIERDGGGLMSDCVFQRGCGRFFLCVFKSSDGFWKNRQGVLPFIKIKRNRKGEPGVVGLNLILGGYSLNIMYDRR